MGNPHLPYSFWKNKKIITDIYTIDALCAVKYSQAAICIAEVSKQARGHSLGQEEGGGSR